MTKGLIKKLYSIIKQLFLSKNEKSFLGEEALFIPIILEA